MGATLNAEKRRRPWSAAVGLRLSGELVYAGGRVDWFGLAHGSA